jgi:hypothetical protein
MLLAATGLVFAIGVIVSALILFSGIRQYGSADDELASSVRRLRSFYSKKPFASKRNIDVERENARELARQTQALLSVLRRGQVGLVAGTPSGFMARYNKTRNRLQEAADQQGISLPEPHPYAFAFDAYAGGVPPAPADVPRLLCQLIIIEQLAGVLLSSNVKSIAGIRREVFEKTGVRGAAPLAGVGLIGKDELFARMHFVLEFKAKEAALWEVLNRLVEHDMHLVVTSIDAAKEGGDVLSEDALRAELAAPGANTPTPGRTGEAYPPREERVVSGPAMDKPMTVKIELDVYRFRKE